MKMRVFFAFILVAVIGIANAAAGDIPPRKGGFCVCNQFRGTPSVFQCEHLGNVTISQIYEKGWRVVIKQDVRGVVSAVELVIEEQ